MLILLAAIVFTVGAFPLWTIIHCVTSRRGNRFKALWVLTMLFLWPFASAVYAVFAVSGHKALRAIGVLLILLYLGLGMAMVSTTYRVCRQASQTFDRAREAASRWDVSALAADEREVLLSTIEELKGDASAPWYLYRGKMTASQFAPLLNLITGDGVVTRDEYDHWQNLVSSRSQKSYEEVDRDIRRYVKGHNGSAPLAVSGGEAVAYDD